MRNINVGYKANYMKNNNKSVIVPMIIVSTLGWSFFANEAIKTKQLEDSNKNKPIIEDVKEVSVSEKVKESHQNFYDEYERLKEEEHKRLEELERQRLLKLEQERLAEIARVEAEKKRKLALEEAKKKELQSKKEVVYNDNSSGWMTFNISYYGTDCYGCGNFTASGIHVANTNYYKGYRIIAADTSILPMGTLVEIITPNEKISGIIGDRGGAIKGYKLDVLVSSEAHASKLGRHNGKLRVIGKMEIK